MRRGCSFMRGLGVGAKPRVKGLGFRACSQNVDP